MDLDNPNVLLIGALIVLALIGKIGIGVGSTVSTEMISYAIGAFVIVNLAIK